MIRIESTYLLEKLPEGYENFDHDEIIQGYLIDGEDSARIRKIGDSYAITRKMLAIPGNNRYIEQHDVEISKEEFDKIFNITHKQIHKIRYHVPKTGEGEIKIDIFKNGLEGLKLAEVTFFDEDNAEAFKPPEWFGREVTDEEWASNNYLADKKLVDIQDKVKKDESE